MQSLAQGTGLQPLASHRQRGHCKASTSSHAPLVTSASLYGRRVPQWQPQRSGPAARNLTLQVTDAITRQKKEETVERLSQQLEKSIVVFGVRYKNIPDKAVTGFRTSLPEDAKMIMAKNTLMRIAADRVEGWSEIKEATTLENAWVFAGEDGVATTVKAFIDFEKGLLQKVDPKLRKTAKPTDISGGVLQGQFLDYGMVRKLESMPTRSELMQKLARLIRKVPTKLAIGIKLVPTKVAVAVKQLADGDENTDLKVGDVFPKAESTEAPAAEAPAS